MNLRRFTILGLLALSGCQAQGSEGEKVRGIEQQVVSGEEVNVSFTVPATVSNTGVLISSTNRVQIDDGASLGASSSPVVVVGGDGAQSEFGSGVKVFGDIIGGSDVLLRSQMQAYGNVRASGQVNKQDGSVVVTGTSVSGAVIPDTTTSWNIQWPEESGGNITLPPDTPNTPVAPGRYGSVIAYSRSTLTFSSGTYYLDTLTLEPQVNFRVDASGGPVEIYVGDAMTLNVGINYVGGDEGQVLIGYLGDQNIIFQEAMAATILAPNAKIELRRPSNDATHKGSYFAKAVQVYSDAKVELLPFEFKSICTPDRDPCETTCDDCVQTIPPAAIYPKDPSKPSRPPTDPGCQPLLKIVDGELVSVPASTTDHEACQNTIEFCDVDGNPIPTPTDEELNSAGPSDVCEAVGPIERDCIIMPGSLRGSCVDTSDCASNEECVPVCTDDTCTDFTGQCGTRAESCGGLPEESNCKDFFICGDPADVGNDPLSEDDYEDSLVDEGAIQGTVPQPTASVGTPAVLSSYEPVESPQCPEGVIDLTELFSSQANGDDDTSPDDASDPKVLGSEKFGLYYDYYAIYGQDVKFNKNFGQESFELGAGAGIEAGVKIFGENLQVFSIDAGLHTSDCGSELFSELQFFGHTLASIDTEKPYLHWFGQGSGLEFHEDDFEPDKDCRDLLEEWTRNSDRMQEGFYNLKTLAGHYNIHGMNRDTCQLTEQVHDLEAGSLNCETLDDEEKNILLFDEDYKIRSAWKKAYNDEHQEAQLKRAALGEARKNEVLNVNPELYGWEKQFSIVGAETWIQAGPVTITLAAELFGNIYVTGRLNLNFAYGDAGKDDLIAMATDFATNHPIAHPEDMRARVGVTLEPGAGVNAAIFAGVGLPGIAIGLEGQILIFGVAFPATTGVSLAGVVISDSRDRTGTDFDGDTCGLPVDESYEWFVPWDYGFGMEYSFLTGRINLAVRISLWIIKATMRWTLYDWEGPSGYISFIGGETNIGGKSTVDPLGGEEYVGLSGNLIPTPCVDEFDKMFGVPTDPDLDISGLPDGIVDCTPPDIIIR